MAKSFGDAFVIDLKTRAIRCLTCGIPGAAFLRVMHLKSGDDPLIGAEKFTEIPDQPGARQRVVVPVEAARLQTGAVGTENERRLVYLKALMLISFSETSGQNPELPRGASNLIVAEVDLSAAVPSLKNKHVVVEPGQPAHWRRRTSSTATGG